MAQMVGQPNPDGFLAKMSAGAWSQKRRVQSSDRLSS